jgi:hypothetical protein
LSSDHEENKSKKKEKKEMKKRNKKSKKGKHSKKNVRGKTHHWTSEETATLLQYWVGWGSRKGYNNNWTALQHAMVSIMQLLL